MVTVRTSETSEQALERLLAKARTEGVQLFRDRSDGRHYASSVTTPGRLYYVTGYSCECRGFVAHGRCKHHSALLAALGWTGVDPDPIGTIRVVHVGGHDAAGGWLVGNGEPEWQEPVSSIYEDGSEMIRITGEGFGVRVVWLEHGKTVDDMTSVTGYGSHYQTVAYWLKALGGKTPECQILEAAGLFDDAEVADDIPAAMAA
ncbi:MAG: hypothetical protein ACR2OE_11140 [Thermomicrobiales bacterium]